MRSYKVRARVHPGHLELLESLPLQEGSEVTVTVDLVGEEEPAPPVTRKLSVWNLGAPQPLTRKDYYDDEK